MMLRSKILTLTGAAIFLTATLTQTAHSYFKTMPAEKLHSVQGQTQPAPGPPEKQSVFFIFNNYSQPGTSNEGNRLIASGSPFLIPVDRVRGDMPLSINHSYGITSENTLSDYLYANLKLNMLLKDYDSIRKKKTKYFAGGSISRKDRSHGDGPLANHKRSSAKRKNSIRQDEEAENLYRFLQQKHMKHFLAVHQAANPNSSPPEEFSSSHNEISYAPVKGRKNQQKPELTMGTAPRKSKFITWCAKIMSDLTRYISQNKKQLSVAVLLFFIGLTLISIPKKR